MLDLRGAASVQQGMRSAVLGAMLLAAACKKTSSTSSVPPPDAAQTAAVEGDGAPPTCPLALEVSLAVQNALANDASYSGTNSLPFGFRGARVLIDDRSVSPDQRGVASVNLAPPFFALPFAPATDLCIDEGTTPASLRAACIDDIGRVVHIEAKTDAGSIVVMATRDGSPPREIGRRPHACAAAGRLRWSRVVSETPEERQGQPVRARVASFEALQKAFANDSLSPRCLESAARVRDVDAIVRVTDERQAHCDAAVEIAIPAIGVRKSLGRMGDTCGARGITLYDDARAMEVVASDMGVEKRIAYQLGDTLFVLNADDRFEEIRIPCGVHLRFRADYRAAVVQHGTMLTGARRAPKRRVDSGPDEEEHQAPANDGASRR